MRQYIAVIVAACLFISSCSVQPINVRPISLTKPVITANVTIQIDKPSVTLYKPVLVNSNDLNCLTKGIYYEARGEPTAGKLAVGFVIINRTLDKTGRYPDSICSVVKQNTIYHGKKVCQFSWYCNHGEKKLNAVLSGIGYENSLIVAYKILKGLVDNNVPRAVSFHVSKLKAGWTKTGELSLVTRIGNHNFYKRNDPNG